MLIFGPFEGLGSSIAHDSLGSAGARAILLAWIPLLVALGACRRR